MLNHLTEFTWNKELFKKEEKSKRIMSSRSKRKIRRNQENQHEIIIIDQSNVYSNSTTFALYTPYPVLYVSFYLYIYVYEWINTRDSVSDDKR